MFVVAVITYMVASLFLSLFEEAVKAMLTCLCIDLDAHAGEPMFGPATFHDDYMKREEGRLRPSTVSTANQIQ